MAYPTGPLPPVSAAGDDSPSAAFRGGFAAAAFFLPLRGGLPADREGAVERHVC